MAKRRIVENDLRLPFETKILGATVTGESMDTR